MHKIIFSLFIVLFTSSNAQYTRFYYEYKFAPDSTNLNETKGELMLLDVSNEGSLFWSQKVFEEDSLVAAGESRKGNYKYQGAETRFVIKNYSAKSVKLFTTVNQNLIVDFNPNISWKILPETDKIRNMKVQKATATINNCNWIAWFSPEIPINDGPYIFQGLPGLIIKMVDQLGSQSFELKGIRKIKNIDLKKSHFSFKSKPIEVNEKEYKKIIRNFYENPIEEEDSSHSSHKYFKIDGTEVSRAEFILIIKKQREESVRKNNNMLYFDVLRK